MSGWYLQQISIEGFRGINNQGSPLVLKLKPDSVNSISAPNGVGKTSIFEAVVYAITGQIPKLDELPAVERGANYYLNRFHSGGLATIALTVLPPNGGAAVTITVQRDSNGNRTVSASGGADGVGILADLNREFVLLDGKTFQEFIDLKPLDRGRSFAGLLGLGRYSLLRQALLSAANTRAFRNHFGLPGKETARDTAEVAARAAKNNIQEAYRALVGEDYDPALLEADMLARAHASLQGIDLLKPLCEGKKFEEIDPSACVEAAKSAEGGEDRDKLAGLLRQETEWTEAASIAPSDEAAEHLLRLAEARDAALAKTQGDTFRQLYVFSERILAGDAWPNKTTCPTCDRQGGDSVLEHVRAKLEAFNAVGVASGELRNTWSAEGWAQLTKLESLAIQDGEPRLVVDAQKAGADGAVDGMAAQQLIVWARTLRKRAETKFEELSREKHTLEKALPPKLTAVVEKAEAARRLQSNLTDLRKATTEIDARADELKRIVRVKAFLDEAHSTFADAESRTASRRLKAIEPKCRDIFSAIMFEDVVPALSKREGTEEISLSLSEFWTLENVSAQALLSESYRNAFAISVYLAAASLYAGEAKFLILDDVTSSFDSGHQFHLMNVIREKFARPGVPDGPQVILLSHDTVLEKLFNANSNEGGWWHQCIQGTPRTAVLPQSGAVSRIKDTTLSLLDVGNTNDAAPRIRQYLEFKLQEIINKVGIPVPITIAFNDDNQMAKKLIDAINRAVDLHTAAKQISLEPNQISSMNTAVATIVGNYTSHWSTGQTHTFTAGSLKGVMKAIDDFARCFQYEEPAGSGQYRYYKSIAQKN